LEPVRLTGGHDDGLARLEIGPALIQPNLGFAAKNRQNLLDGMMVSWSAGSRLAPLVKYAELRRPNRCGHEHSRRYARSPNFAHMILMVYDLHGASPAQSWIKVIGQFSPIDN
jgi:hypothetical protein